MQETMTLKNKRIIIYIVILIFLLWGIKGKLGMIGIFLVQRHYIKQRDILHTGIWWSGTSDAKSVSLISETTLRQENLISSLKTEVIRERLIIIYVNCRIKCYNGF